MTKRNQIRTIALYLWQIISGRRTHNRGITFCYWPIMYGRSAFNIAFTVYFWPLKYENRKTRNDIKAWLKDSDEEELDYYMQEFSQMSRIFYEMSIEYGHAVTSMTEFKNRTKSLYPQLDFISIHLASGVIRDNWIQR